MICSIAESTLGRVEALVKLFLELLSRPSIVLLQMEFVGFAFGEAETLTSSCTMTHIDCISIAFSNKVTKVELRYCRRLAAPFSRCLAYEKRCFPVNLHCVLVNDLIFLFPK